MVSLKVCATYCLFHVGSNLVGGVWGERGDCPLLEARIKLKWFANVLFLKVTIHNSTFGTPFLPSVKYMYMYLVN